MGGKQGSFQNKSILNGKWFELKLVRFVPGAGGWTGIAESISEGQLRDQAREARLNWFM